jgi:hypothetical protein
MNDPKRYRLDPESYLAEHPQGDFIDYQDYARLKAQVERLTKAGDLLAFHYISLGRKFFPNDPLPSSLSDWHAAKEGKGQP